MKPNIITELQVMIEWWAKRDANAFILAFVVAAPLTVGFKIFLNPGTPELAMMVTTPLVVLYLLVRVLAVIASRHPVSEKTPAPAFIHWCAWVAAVATVVFMVATLSWVTFLILGPADATRGAFTLASAAVFSWIVAIVCMIGHGPAVAGHRMIFSPALDRLEIEVVKFVELIRKLMSRGQPPAFRLP